MLVLLLSINHCFSNPSKNDVLTDFFHKMLFFNLTPRNTSEIHLYPPLLPPENHLRPKSNFVKNSLLFVLTPLAFRRITLSPYLSTHACVCILRKHFKKPFINFCPTVPANSHFHRSALVLPPKNCTILALVYNILYTLTQRATGDARAWVCLSVSLSLFPSLSRTRAHTERDFYRRRRRFFSNPSERGARERAP